MNTLDQNKSKQKLKQKQTKTETKTNQTNQNNNNSNNGKRNPRSQPYIFGKLNTTKETISIIEDLR
jgi:hypothetical protein